MTMVPYQPAVAAPVAGKLAQALVFEKDIVAPMLKAIY